MTHIYRTDYRTDGPNRSGPISVLLKSVLGPVLGPDRGPNGPDRTVNIPSQHHFVEPAKLREPALETIASKAIVDLNTANEKLSQWITSSAQSSNTEEDQIMNTSSK